MMICILEIVVVETFPEQDSVGHVLDDCAFAGAILEADTVADLLAELDSHFLADSFGHAHGRHSPGLGAADHPVLAVALLP